MLYGKETWREVIVKEWRKERKLGIILLSSIYQVMNFDLFLSVYIVVDYQFSPIELYIAQERKVASKYKSTCSFYSYIQFFSLVFTRDIFFSLSPMAFTSLVITPMLMFPRFLSLSFSPRLVALKYIRFPRPPIKSFQNTSHTFPLSMHKGTRLVFLFLTQNPSSFL